MERQPPPMSPLKAMERQTLKEPFSLVHENSMRSSYGAAGTEPSGTKFNPYNRHEPGRNSVAPELHDKVNSMHGAPVAGRAKSNTRMRAPQETRNLEHHRPRPISTGRIFTSETGREAQDAQAVTKAILDLRERREQSQSARRQLKQHPLHAHRNQSSHGQLEKSQSQDEKASFKLKDAENRIGTLLQELEELRFFHEIDMEPAAIVPIKTIAGVPRASESPIRHKQVLSPRRLASLDRNTLELEAQELQRQVDILMQEKSTLQSKVQLHEQQAKSHSEDANRIHKLESALSSIRSTLNEQIHEIQHGRAQLSEEYELKLKAVKDKYNEAQNDAETLAEELESQKEKLDRLELEYAQYTDQTKDQLMQLQKKWEEKEASFERQLAESLGQVESLHTLLEDREQDIVRLQKELTKSTLDVEKYRRDLKEQDEINKDHLAKALHEHNVRYESLEANFNAVSEEVEAKSQRVVVLEESNILQAQKMDDLEKQLVEMEEKHTLSLDALKKTCEAREQRRLDDLVDAQHSKNIEFEERISDVRKQLQLATDRHQSEIEQREMLFHERIEQAVHDAKNSVRAEYEPKVSTLREELEIFRQKYDAVRQEKKCFQVQSAGKDRDAAREWERRDALRQGEMERLNDKLDVAVRELAEKEARVQSLTQRLAESDQRCQLLLGDLESQHTEEIKARDDILTQRKAVAKLKTELARKDFEIAEIREDMERTLEVMQGQLEMAKKEREQSVLKERSMEDDNRNRLATLTLHLERVQKELVSERARHESLESELRVEIAKFEGKLSAAETTLKDKRLLIEDLEARLLNADELSSSAGGKLQATIASLTRDVDSFKEALAHERQIVKQKELEISGLKHDLVTIKKANDLKLSGLEEALVAAQSKLLGAQNEKAALESELVQIREEHEIAKSSMRSLAIDRDDVAIEVGRVQNELESRIEAYETKIEDMRKLLNDKDTKLHNLDQEIESLKSTIYIMSEEEKTFKNLKSKEENEKENIVRLKEEEIYAKDVQIRALQDEVNKVSANLQQVVDETVRLSSNIEDRQRRILELEETLEATKCSSSEVISGSEEAVVALRNELKEKDSKLEEITQNMARVMDERAEAIDALEQMIEEVQLRQEEFDDLADILARREEELENAKQIATKALASAQQIKARYKQKGYKESDKQTDLLLKIDGLNAEVDFLKGKTNELRKKSTRMEAELREKNIQCAKLRDELREQETKSTQSSSIPSSVDKDGFLPVAGNENLRAGKLNDFMSVRDDRGGVKDFMLLESGLSFQDSEAISPSTISEDIINESTPLKSTDLGDATTWLQDFEDGKSAFSDTVAVETPAKNRSAERDKVRNFVRKRYLRKSSEVETKVG